MNAQYKVNKDDSLKIFLHLYRMPTPRDIFHLIYMYLHVIQMSNAGQR